MDGYNFAIEVSQGGKRLEMDFALDKHPKTLVEFDDISVTPLPGRTFGDNEQDGTPCTVHYAGLDIEATFWGKEGQGFVINRV